MKGSLLKKIITIREGLILILLISFFKDINLDKISFIDAIVGLVGLGWCIGLARKINREYKKSKEEQEDF